MMAMEMGLAMSGVVELVSDDEGISIIGGSTDVERFLLSAGLDHVPSRDLDLHRLWSYTNTAGAAAHVGSTIAANSGRWVKLTAESAEAVRKYGLMATKTKGVSHAMIGNPGDIKKWIQIVDSPAALLGGPLALASLSTMMQQQAMQQQMDEIVDYLKEIDEKVDDILRGQKDAVLADMIGVDLIIDEAMTVRDAVGRVSDVTWSKVQATGVTIARTQAYAVRQLDAIAEKLEAHADLGEIAKATRQAEPQVREWLAVLARTVQLQEGLSVLELDRVLSSVPDDLEDHRLGLVTARRNRRELLARTTTRLLDRMAATVQEANKKVLLNPFDAPAAVKSSNQVAVGVVDFRTRIGIEASHDTEEAKRWGQAAAEMRDKVLVTASEGATAASRVGAETLDRATGVFRSVDLDGDGIADQPRAAAAAEEAGRVVKNAAAAVGEALGSRFGKKKG